jgi:UDP-N-acetylglucosamine acyltransferase
MVAKDVPPFCIAQGDRAVLRGINAIGMNRGGFSAEEVQQVRRLYKFLFLGEGTFRARFDSLPQEILLSTSVQRIVAFIRESKRGICSVSDSGSEE